MSRSCNLRAVATLCLLASTRAVAQEPAGEVVTLPSDLVSDEDRRNFRLCRMAVIYEREAGEDAVLDPLITAMLDEQIAFIMADTVFNTPALSYADGKKRLKFFEDWTLTFSREIGDWLGTLRDRDTRATVLRKCQPEIWGIVRHHIDTLIRWRARAMQTEGAPRLYRRLPGEE